MYDEFMKIIRSGGTNASLAKDDPNYAVYGYGNYFLLQLKPEIDQVIESGGEVAICVAAKPNKDRYDKPLEEMGYQLAQLTILGREDVADWSAYDAVMLLGGETKELHDWLVRTGFSIDKLTKCRLLGGDSAGAYVLGSKTIVDYEKDGSSFEIIDGFMPESNLLVAAHVNNTFYHETALGEALKNWASKNNVEYLELEENQLNIRNR